MKQLITKSDGTPTKSKVFAIKFLQDKGIDESCLIQENGQFFYEGVNDNPLEMIAEAVKDKDFADAFTPLSLLPVSWDTPVFDKNNQKTVLVIPSTGITATINAKHPAGQLRTTGAFEIAIGQENFVMSMDLISKLFRVRG